jgi:hypothetical protein
MSVKVRDVNEEKAKTVVGETVEGKKIICVYNPHNNLFFLAFAEGGQIPKEFEGYFTDQARAQKQVEVYLSRKLNESGNAPKAEPFIPELKVNVPTKPKPFKPAASFVKEFNKIQDEVMKESIKKEIDPSEPQITHLGKKEEEPQFEVGTLNIL